MNLTEVDSRKLLADIGVPVHPATLVSSPQMADDVAEKIGCQVVLKAEVGIGSRGKAGAVKICMPDEVLKVSTELFDMSIHGHKVEKCLIAPAVDIEKEMYLSIILDTNLKRPFILVSGSGGGDIEEIAEDNPELILKIPISINSKNSRILYDEISEFLNIPENLFDSFSKIANALIDGFWRYHASLIEINPLVIDKSGRLMAVDAKVKIDDYSPASVSNLDVDTAPHMKDNEKLAKSKGLSYVQLDGDVACIVNGAGLAMATIDAISEFGMRPANFLDVGGSSSPQKMIDALSIIQSGTSVKAILVNIFGGITRCTDIARGLLTAIKTLGDDIALVIHLSGTESDTAREDLKCNDLSCHNSMKSALEQLKREMSAK